MTGLVVAGILCVALALSCIVLACMDQRKVHRLGLARTYKNPELHELTDFAYAARRVGFFVAGIIFIIPSIVILSYALPPDITAKVKTVAGRLQNNGPITVFMRGGFSQSKEPIDLIQDAIQRAMRDTGNDGTLPIISSKEAVSEKQYLFTVVDWYKKESPHCLEVNTTERPQEQPVNNTILIPDGKGSMRTTTVPKEMLGITRTAPVEVMVFEGSCSDTPRSSARWN